MPDDESPLVGAVGATEPEPRHASDHDDDTHPAQENRPAGSGGRHRRPDDD